MLRFKGRAAPRQPQRPLVRGTTEPERPRAGPPHGPAAAVHGHKAGQAAPCLPGRPGSRGAVQGPGSGGARPAGGTEAEGTFLQLRRASPRPALPAAERGCPARRGPAGAGGARRGRGQGGARGRSEAAGRWMRGAGPGRAAASGWSGRTEARALPAAPAPARARSRSWAEGGPQPALGTFLHFSLECPSLVPFQLPTLYRLHYTTAPFVM